MVFLRYIATIIPGLAALLAYEMLFLWPDRIILILAMWTVVLIGVHIFFGRGDAKSFSHWQFAIPPATLFYVGATYSMLVDSTATRQTIAFAVAFLIAALFWNLYLYLYQPVRYQTNALEHLSHLSNLLAVFFGAVSLFGLRLFLGLPAWAVATGVFFGGLLLTQQSFWVSKLPAKQTVGYVFLAPILLTQIAIGLLGLPVTYAVSGSVVALFYYAIIGVIRSVLRGRYSHPVGLRYLAIAGGGSLLLLLSAHWS